MSPIIPGSTVAIIHTRPGWLRAVASFQAHPKLVVFDERLARPFAAPPCATSSRRELGRASPPIARLGKADRTGAGSVRLEKTAAYFRSMLYLFAASCRTIEPTPLGLVPAGWAFAVSWPSMLPGSVRIVAILEKKRDHWRALPAEWKGGHA
jgi:hypothetical protein